MATKHYQHPKTGEVIGLDDPLPRPAPVVTTSPETGEETTTESPPAADELAVTKALEDGYVLLSDDEFESWKVAQEKARQDALPYAVKRAAAYPPQTDFLDAWVKQDEKALDAYRAACFAVKDKFPKG